MQDFHEETVYRTLSRSIINGESWKEVLKGNFTQFSPDSFKQLPNIDIVLGSFQRSNDQSVTWEETELSEIGWATANGKDVAEQNGEVYRRESYSNKKLIIAPRDHKKRILE